MPETKIEKRPFVVRLSNGKRLNLTVRRPTLQESDLSEEEYTAVFNRSLLQGSPTRQKMHLVLKKKGLIDQADSDRMVQLSSDVREIDEQVKKLAKRLDKKEEKDFNEHDRQIDGELKDLQKKRVPLMQEFNELRLANDSMFSRTSDQQAENAQRNFLLACTIEYGADNSGFDEGERVWDGVDTLMKETEGEKYQRSLYEYMMLVQDLPSDGDDVFKTNEPQTTGDKKDGEDNQQKTTPPESLTDEEREAAEPIADPSKRDPAEVDTGKPIMKL